MALDAGTSGAVCSGVPGIPMPIWLVIAGVWLTVGRSRLVVG